MRVSDVITNVTKQNMNVMASTLSAYHVKRWRKQKKKKKVSANQNNFDINMFLTFYLLRQMDSFNLFYC